MTVDQSEQVEQERLNLWLRSSGLGKYYDTLIDNEFDSLRAVAHISAADLMDLGIIKIGARRKFLTCTKELRAAMAESAILNQSWDHPLKPLMQGPQPVLMSKERQPVMITRERSNSKLEKAPPRSFTSMALIDTHEPGVEPERPSGPRPSSANSNRATSAKRPSSAGKTRFPPVLAVIEDDIAPNPAWSTDETEEDLVKVLQELQIPMHTILGPQKKAKGKGCPALVEVGPKAIGATQEDAETETQQSARAAAQSLAPALLQHQDSMLSREGILKQLEAENEDLEFIVDTADELLQLDYEEQLAAIRATKEAMKKRMASTMVGVFKAKSKFKKLGAAAAAKRVEGGVGPSEAPVPRARKREKRMIMSKSDWSSTLDQQQQQLDQVNKRDRAYTNGINYWLMLPDTHNFSMVDMPTPADQTEVRLKRKLKALIGMMGTVKELESRPSSSSDPNGSALDTLCLPAAAPAPAGPMTLE